jgi:hypothetical protein
MSSSVKETLVSVGSARLNDEGTAIQATVLDCGQVPPGFASATVKTIKWKKPSGAVESRTASFVTDGSDGKIRYLTVAGDLDEIGTWEYQAYIELAGRKFHTSILAFTVRRILV